MNDKLTRGFIAGSISGVIITLFNIFLENSGINMLGWLDWMGVIIFDHGKPFSLGENVLAFLAIPIFTGTLGIVFNYLIPLVTSKNLLFKGWLWGILIWFLLDGITSLFKIEELTHPSLASVIVTYGSASLYGIFLAQLVSRLEHAESASLELHPAMKPLDKNDGSDPVK